MKTSVSFVLNKISATRLFKKVLPLAAAVALASPAVHAEQVDLVGLNLSGAGFAAQVLPGIDGTNYIFPVESYFQQWNAKGIKLIRFPIIWERLQPTLGGALDPTYTALIDRTFGYANKYGMKIILDLHNYTMYRGTIIGTGNVSYNHYQQIMTLIAQRWSGQPSLYAYDIMNEPHDSMTQWPIMAQYGINGVRSVDKVKPIMIEGNGWSEATRWPWWNDSLLNLKDPSNNLIFQAHSYFDEDAGGNYTAIDVNKLDANYGVERVKPFVEWLKKNGKRGMIGEFGVPDNNPRWNLLMDNMLAYLKQNCIPATYWAAGPGWGSYFLSVEPINGQDRPQWPTLKKYIDNTTCTAIGPFTAPVATTPTPAPTPTVPSTSTGYSSAINNFTNADWLNGVYRKAAGFSVAATSGNTAAFKVGTSVRLANGLVTKISSVQVVGSNMSVWVNSSALDGAVVGYPNKLTVADAAGTGATTPAPTPAPTAPAPTPAPTAPAVVATSTMNNFTNTDWLNGVMRKAAAISLPATTANTSAFKTGASVRLANGQVYKIKSVQMVGSNMSVFLDTPTLLNGSAVGYPNALTVVSQ
ncbi:MULTISPECIES: glycoside hydrolase family 5 protein [Pseudomonas]|uniref:Glycoside hydrolase family 5 protein n=1 Tax=Pseudomonas luteola TaxID=47886 RepID=A0ABS0MSV1_PSELU|nr:MULTISPECIES: glycoside hydrolase family 5 protein [Pseudomonas]MBH3439809.1 glycoside hydrolase family 5 protein [Pseudomonas luteola]MDN3236239.1 glycoside hydrolase family 5 protein [Pseudomonas sp. WAC2]